MYDGCQPVREERCISTRCACDCLVLPFGASERHCANHTTVQQVLGSVLPDRYRRPTAHIRRSMDTWPRPLCFIFLPARNGLHRTATTPSDGCLLKYSPASAHYSLQCPIRKSVLYSLLLCSGNAGLFLMPLPSGYPLHFSYGFHVTVTVPAQRLRRLFLRLRDSNTNRAKNPFGAAGAFFWQDLVIHHMIKVCPYACKTFCF